MELSNSEAQGRMRVVDEDTGEAALAFARFSSWRFQMASSRKIELLVGRNVGGSL